MIQQSTISACVKAYYGCNDETDYGKIQAVLMAYESMKATPPGEAVSGDQIVEANKMVSGEPERTPEDSLVVGSPAVEVAYDRSLIADMLTPGNDAGYTRESMSEQAELLRADDNRDASGVRTVCKWGGDGQDARHYSAALARAIPHLPTQSLRDEFAKELDFTASRKGG